MLIRRGDVLGPAVAYGSCGGSDPAARTAPAVRVCVLLRVRDLLRVLAVLHVLLLLLRVRVVLGVVALRVLLLRRFAPGDLRAGHQQVLLAGRGSADAADARAGPVWEFGAGAGVPGGTSGCAPAFSGCPSPGIWPVSVMRTPRPSVVLRPTRRTAAGPP